MAGCLGESGESTEPETADDGSSDADESEDSDEENGNENTSGTELTESELDEKLANMDEIDHQEVHFARTHDTPTWAESEERPYGHLELYGSTDDALQNLPFESVATNREDKLKEFIDETDFRQYRLLYVVAVGLGTSNLTTKVEQLGIYDEQIVGTATIQNGEEGDSMDMYASTLVRATPDEGASLPKRAVMSITSYHDRAGIVEATSD
ncbi:hypothetical protein BRD03_12840 [Halobacteriales archaeon QS_9_68_17]|nr:MAG: hypothetical protein BRD03_12840 [Halobacteriales archaeon QS_9_68_17]